MDMEITFAGGKKVNASFKGHLHRKGSKTVQKALDFVEVILVKYNLAGDYYREKAKLLIAEESLKFGPEKMPESKST